MEIFRLDPISFIPIDCAIMSKPDLHTESLIQTVKSEGVAVLKYFVKDIAPVKDKAISLFNQIQDGEQAEFRKTMKAVGPYEAGKLCRMYPEAYPKFPDIYGIFDTAWHHEVVKGYLGPHHEFCKQIFISHEYKVETSDVVRNAYLHFDPFHALKFILYLTDTTKENGAFRYVPKSRQLGEKLRKEFCQTEEGRIEAYRLDFHKNIKLGEADTVYCEAPAGSLIIFDTDTIHGGGLLQKPDTERMVINFQSRAIDYQSNLFERILQKLF